MKYKRDSGVSGYLLLLFVGPVTECFCCRALSKSETKRWGVYFVVTLMISLPFAIMSIVEVNYIYGAFLNLLASMYLILKSVIDLRTTKRESASCQCRSEYLLITSSVVSLSSLVLVPFEEKCMNNEDGYSDNPNDDNYCPFLVNLDTAEA